MIPITREKKLSFSVPLLVFGLFFLINLLAAPVWAQLSTKDQQKHIEEMKAADQQVTNASPTQLADALYKRGNTYLDVVNASLPLLNSAAPHAALTAYESYARGSSLPALTDSQKRRFDTILSDRNLYTNLINYGAFVFQKKVYAEALKSFIAATKVMPKDTTAPLYAGIAAQQLKDTATSRLYLEIYIVNGGLDAAVYLNLVAHYQINKAYERALQVLEKGLTVLPGQSSLQSEYTNTLLRSGRIEEAIQRLIQNAEQDPLNATTLLTLGILYGDRAINVDREINDMVKKGKKRNESEVVTLTRYQKNLGMKSYQYYKRSLGLNPENFDALYNTGAYVFNEAVYLKRLVDEMDGASFQKKGRSLESQVCGLFNSALPYFEKAYIVKSTDADLNKNLALLRSILKQFKDNNIPCTPVTLEDQTISDYTAPELTITSPVFTEGIYTTSQSSPELMLQGKATDNDRVATLLINNQTVSVQADGTFLGKVSLKPGINRLDLMATDASRNTLRREMTVYYQSASQASLSSASPGQYYALIVSAQNYQDVLVPPLTETHKDAQRLYNMLTNKYGFISNNIIKLSDPNRIDLLDAIDNLAERVGPKDNVLIFFSGHGQWDPVTKQGYWLLKEASKSRRGTWLNNVEVEKSVNALRARHILLVSDACFSGSIVARTDPALDASTVLLERPSRKVMSSGNLTVVPERSLFIDYLLKRLEQNSEKYLSASRLFYSFREAVIKSSPIKLEPMFGTIAGDADQGGEFIFVKP